MGALLRGGTLLFVAAAGTAIACGSQPAPTSGNAEKTSESTAALKAAPLPETAGESSPPIVHHNIARPRPAVDREVPAAGRCNMTYYGGQVLQKPILINVNWSSAVTSTVQTLMPQFLTAAPQSDWMAWMSEYGTAGLLGKDGKAGSDQGMTGYGSYGGSYTLVPSLCG